MRVTITCEDCGHRMLVARHILKSETINIVCHECELPLSAEATIAVTVPTAFRDFQLWPHG